MSAPQWSPVDEETENLLTLVADEGHVSADFEWDAYRLALVAVAERGTGIVNPNRLRDVVRGQVAPRRIGAFTHRALSQGLVQYTGQFVISDDTEGRNAGRPCREMRLLTSEQLPAGSVASPTKGKSDAM